MRYAWTLIGFAWIAFWVGLAAGQVGQIPECTGEPNQAWLPILIFSAIGVPFAIGFLAGKEHSE